MCALCLPARLHGSCYCYSCCCHCVCVSVCVCECACLCVCECAIELWQHFRLPAPASAPVAIACHSTVLCPARCVLLPAWLPVICPLHKQGKLFAIMRVPSESLRCPLTSPYCSHYSHSNFYLYATLHTPTSATPIITDICNEMTTVAAGAQVPSPPAAPSASTSSSSCLIMLLFLLHSLLVLLPLAAGVNEFHWQLHTKQHQQ